MRDDNCLLGCELKNACINNSLWLGIHQYIINYIHVLVIGMKNLYSQMIRYHNLILINKKFLSRPLRQFQHPGCFFCCSKLSTKLIPNHTILDHLGSLQFDKFGLANYLINVRCVTIQRSYTIIILYFNTFVTPQLFSEHLAGRILYTHR